MTTTTKTTKTQTAAECYAERMAAIRKRMAHIEECLKKHEADAAKDARNWGYAGDLGECMHHLATLPESLGGDHED